MSVSSPQSFSPASPCPVQSGCGRYHTACSAGQIHWALPVPLDSAQVSDRELVLTMTLLNWHSSLGNSNFLYCSWGCQGKNTEVVCHSLLQWTTFCQTSPPWPTCLGWPHTAWLNFIELDNAVVRVIRLTSFLWLWFQCVCPLTTPIVLLGFLLPWMWGISSRLLQQSTAAAPYLGRGVSPHRHPFWPRMWNSSCRPSCARAATIPWRWGWSSRLPSLALDAG